MNELNLKIVKICPKCLMEVQASDPKCLLCEYVFEKEDTTDVPEEEVKDFKLKK